MSDGTRCPSYQSANPTILPSQLHQIISSSSSPDSPSVKFSRGRALSDPRHPIQTPSTLTARFDFAVSSPLPVRIHSMFCQETKRHSVVEARPDERIASARGVVCVFELGLYRRKLVYSESEEQRNLQISAAMPIPSASAFARVRERSLSAALIASSSSLEG